MLNWIAVTLKVQSSRTVMSKLQVRDISHRH